MMRSPDALSAWMERVGMRRPPSGFFGKLASLAAEAEEADYERLRARQMAAERSGPNLRRRDAVELRALVSGAADRLPQRLRQVAILCLIEGMSIAQAAAALTMSPNTVRSHLRRLREMAARNATAAAAAAGASARSRAGRSR